MWDDRLMIRSLPVFCALAATVAVGCGLDASHKALFLESIQATKLANLVTDHIELDGATLHAGAPAGQGLPSEGPAIESCVSPFHIAVGHPLELQLTLTLPDAARLAELRLKVVAAEHHLRLPITADPVTGVAKVSGTLQSFELPHSLERVDTLIYAVDADGSVGEPITLPLVMVAKESHLTRPMRTLAAAIAPDASVRAIAFADPSDEDLLATGGHDGDIRLWDLKSGHLVRTFEGHTDWVVTLALSSDAQRMVSGARDNTTRIWDRTNGALLATFGDHLDSVESVAVTQDGGVFASGSWDGTIRVRSTTDGSLVAVLDAGSPVNEIAFTPDDVPLPVPLLAAVTGRLLQTGSVQVWRTDTWERVANRETPREVTALAFSPAAPLLAIAMGRGQLRVVDLTSAVGQGELSILELDPPEELIPDGKRILTSKSPRDTIPSMRFNPANPDRIGIVTLTGLIAFWSMEKRAIVVNVASAQPVLEVAFTDDSPRMALGDATGFTRVTPIDDLLAATAD